MNIPSVVLEDVHLTLTAGSGPVNILSGVNLSVEQGETLAVVGPSGSGKTTMLMLMAGLERQSSGQVRLAGVDLTGMSEDELARFRRENLGIVFQAFHLIPTMTALENAALPLEFAHHPNAKTRAMDALEQETLMEVGNILIGACVGKLAELLGDNVTYSPPRVISGNSPSNAIPADTFEKDSSAIVLKTVFCFNERNVEGFLFLVTSHDSIVWLKKALATFMEQYE